MKNIRSVLFYLPSAVVGYVTFKVIKDLKVTDASLPVIIQFLIILVVVFFIGILLDTILPDFNLNKARKMLYDFKNYIGDIDDYRKEIFKLKGVIQHSVDTTKEAERLMVQLNEIINKMDRSNRQEFLSVIEEKNDSIKDYRKIILSIIENIALFKESDEQNVVEIATQLEKAAEHSLNSAGINIITPTRGAEFDEDKYEIADIIKDETLPNGVVVKCLYSGIIHQGGVIKKAKVIINKKELYADSKEEPISQVENKYKGSDISEKKESGGNTKTLEEKENMTAQMPGNERSEK